MEKEEATFRNYTDKELINWVIQNQADNYFAVQLALRLEALLDSLED